MSSGTMHQQQQRTFVQFLQQYSLPLIGGVVLAVVWANVAPESYHHLLHFSPFGHEGWAHHLNFHFLMNDIFMALFFGLAAKEITESCLPGGALNPPSKAVNPLLGTIGGVLGPVGVYLAITAFTGASEIRNGWGIPTATDIALAWLVARVVFGTSHPAVSFLLLLAVADDGIGLGIIAVAYPDPQNPVQPIYLLIVLAAMCVAYVMRVAKVGSFWPYLIVPGVMSWAGLMLGHLHPALALVPIVPFMPTSHHDEGMFAEQQPGHPPHADPLNRFADAFKLPVDLGLFGFGLANAGVEFSNVGTATWAVLFGLLIGKTVGIFAFSAVGHFAGFKLPQGMDFKTLFLAGVTASLGLTVALFVAGVAFTDPGLQGAAKMGALFSAVAGPLVIVLGRLLRVGTAARAPAGGGADAAGMELATGAAPSIRADIH